MPEIQNKTKKLGVTTLISEISCVVDSAKLPDFVIVAVHYSCMGSFTFGEK